MLPTLTICFQDKIDDVLSDYHFTKVGVPECNVLRPILYVLYTANVPLTNEAVVVRFADDSGIRQELLNCLEQCKIRLDPTKTTQITFTTNRGHCPQVSISNTPYQLNPN